MDSILEILTDRFGKAFEKNGYDYKFGRCTVSNRPDLCQFQCNGAMAGAKQYKKAPIMIAREVLASLEAEDVIGSCEAVMPGFINIIVKDEALDRYLQGMSTDEKLGIKQRSLGKTAIIDYGGANVAKPLHVGHLRPAIIGESIKRILAFDGYNAIGDVHLGDWGLPIGEIIVELSKRKPELAYFDPAFEGEYPSEAPFNISDLEEIYPFASGRCKEDADYKEECRVATAELQAGRRGYRALWKHIIEVSKTDLKKNYDNLDVHFELWKGESDAEEYLHPMVEDLKARGIAHMSEGAVVVDVKEDTDTKEMPPCLLIKSDGAAIYASTDLATLVEREKDYKPDYVIYVVDKRQGLHFEQVFRVARKAGIVNENCKLFFVGNGTMNGADGKPFKTRDGGVLRLEYLVRDIAQNVREKMAGRDMSPEEVEEISKKVGLAALKYGDLSNQATKDYNFDIEKFTSFEGNTGPYILYTMVRIKSILEKYASVTGTDVENIRRGAKNGEYCIYDGSGAESCESERKLKLALADFSNSFAQAVNELAPHKICAYIYELSDLFNTFYHENRIIAEEDKDKQKRWIALICLVLAVLEKNIELLGISAPDKM